MEARQVMQTLENPSEYGNVCGKKRVFNLWEFILGCFIAAAARMRLSAVECKLNVDIC